MRSRAGGRLSGGGCDPGVATRILRVVGDGDARTLVCQCCNCVDSRSRRLVPRPLADTVHGTAVGEVVHFDLVYLGESDVAQGSGEFDRFQYVLLVLFEDASGYCLDQLMQCWENEEIRAIKVGLTGDCSVVTEISGDWNGVV